MNFGTHKYLFKKMIEANPHIKGNSKCHLIHDSRLGHNKDCKNGAQCFPAWHSVVTVEPSDPSKSVPFFSKVQSGNLKCHMSSQLWLYWQVSRTDGRSSGTQGTIIGRTDCPRVALSTANQWVPLSKRLRKAPVMECYWTMCPVKVNQIGAVSIRANPIWINNQLKS